MRVFKNELMWDKIEQKFYNTFAVNDESCSQDEFYRELETEQCLEDDEVSEYCQCCNCKNNEDCVDFQCTCGELEDKNGNMDELVIQCECPDCVAMREEQESENECDCLECREEEFISMAHDFIVGSNGCPECILECLVDFADDMKNIGWESHKGFIAEMNEDNTVNISIDNLTINSTGNVDDFVNQLKHLAKISR